MIRNRISTILAGALLLFAGSCAKESGTLREDTCLLPVSLSVEGEEVLTRSVLPEGSTFESAIKEVTVFAYDSSTGRLAAAKHFTSSSFSLTLTRTAPHNLFVFANMGDLSGSAPLSESDVPNISYTIPSYDALASRGMPMAGQKSVAAGATSAPVSLRRLMAKLILKVDNSDMALGGSSQPFENGSMRVCQVARILYPFSSGGSAARSTSDLFTGLTDYGSVQADAAVTRELVLYVPENRQGVLLPGNTEQMDKSYSNTDLNGNTQAGRCTYIEFTGMKLGDVDGVAGDFTYRFYPGADATKNFDLEGGKTYRITLKLTWDGLFVVGNWMVEKNGWSDSRDMHISLGGDETFERDIYVELPPGVSDFYYDIYYSPKSQPYSSSPENGSYRHREYGWTYDLDSMTASAFNSNLSANDGVSVTATSQGGAVTTYKLSIPWDDMLVRESHVITHHTMDRRHEAVLYLDIVEPEINPSPMENVKAWDEYGASNPFTFMVIGGSVPLRYISADCTNANVSLGAFNAENGTVTGYWKSANTGSTRREANIVFSGLDGVAVCRAYQNGKSSFAIIVDDDGGEGDNTYD